MQMESAESYDTEGYDHLVFARGFLLSKDLTATVMPHWKAMRIRDWILRWDPRTSAAMASNAIGGVALLGHAIHLEANTADLQVIARRLQHALSRSRGTFLDELDSLVGRYIVMDYGPHGAWIQSDAGALRNIYYHAGKQLVASHMNLVAEAAGGLGLSAFGLPSWHAENRAFSTPGWETHWEGVRFLNANLELDLETLKPRRVAMKPPEPITSAEAAERVLEMTRMQLPFLTSDSRPVASLTAGQDSRTTLAILRPVKNRVHYFTYALRYAPRQRAVQLDLNDSRRIVDEMGLSSHTLFNLHGPLEDGPLLRIFKRNSIRSSGRNVAARYLADLPPADQHIRSSFNEIGVATFRAKHGFGEATPEFLADILTYKRGYTADTLTATAEYVESTGLNEVQGYDPLDLYYWELRMGSWLGTITAESDLSFSTHILINSRKIIRTLLGPPVEERMRAQTYHHLIGMAWPELYTIPVNGERQMVPGS